MSPKELRLARFVMNGVSNRDIADAIGIAPSVVRGRIFALKRKLAVENRSQITLELIQKFEKQNNRPSVAPPERDMSDIERSTELAAQARNPCLPGEPMNIRCSVCNTSWRSAIPNFWVGRLCPRQGCRGCVDRAGSVRIFDDYGPEAA